MIDGLDGVATDATVALSVKTWGLATPLIVKT